MADAPLPSHPDRLAGSTSAYLRSAAGQPIDWHPWGSEPFEIARQTGRPILLDIGASWCHWCHVMDEGTYADPEVGRLLSKEFVAVKVDRDEHPEVDRRYQRQVGALTGEGGWPLTAFLTPAGEVFLGGTYFPPTDAHGRPGFRRVLGEVARLWREEPDRIRENSAAVRASLERQRGARTRREPTTDAFVGRVLADVYAGYDPVNGGFGGAPKFPHPTALALFLWDARANGRPLGDEHVRETLHRMADGGLYDHVGGGFHRYSVDEAWHIPHFEKMGIDNAALLGAYTDGLARFGDARFDEVLRGTVRWVEETLGDPQGGFGSSQDADNAPADDGGYFTWTRGELKAALSADEFRLALRLYGVGTDARMPHDPDRNVLFRIMTLEEAAAGASGAGAPAEALAGLLERLREARDRRVAPAVDRALYADINGRFVGALARAGTVTGESAWLALARRAADRFLSDAYAPEVGVAHRIEGRQGRGHGLLEDQVAFAGGLLELAVAVAEPTYLRAASQLLDLVGAEYRGEDGLLRDLSPRLYDGPSLGALAEPSYPLEDSPHLAANSGAALALLRLAALTHDEEPREKARRLLAPLASRLGHVGLFAAGAALAAGWADTEPATVVVEGQGPAAAELLRVARRTWFPLGAVFEGTPPEPFSLPSEMAGSGTRTAARALVCLGDRCAPPITRPDELAVRLALVGVRPAS